MCENCCSYRSSNDNMFLPLLRVSGPLQWRPSKNIHFLFSTYLHFIKRHCIYCTHRSGKKGPAKRVHPFFGFRLQMACDFWIRKCQFPTGLAWNIFSPRMADPQTAPTSRVPPSHRGYATECAPNAQAKGGRNAENPGSMRIRKSNHNPKSELICTTPMYSTYPTEKCEAFLEGFSGIWSLPEKNKRSI